MTCDVKLWTVWCQPKYTNKSCSHSVALQPTYMHADTWIINGSALRPGCKVQHTFQFIHVLPPLQAQSPSCHSVGEDTIDKKSADTAGQDKSAEKSWPTFLRCMIDFCRPITSTNFCQSSVIGLTNPFQTLSWYSLQSFTNHYGIITHLVQHSLVLCP